MGKIAFIFPGQGSQYVGMGRELAAAYPEAAQIFAQAEAVLGSEFVKIIMQGPDEDLKQTSVTQPAILTVSVACLSILLARDIRPDFVAGHSLGEYSAHVAAGTFSFADALKVVQERGRLMQEAVRSGGTMAAILGLDRALIEAACRKADAHGIVQVANYNCPGQVVISGQIASVEAAMLLCKEAGAKRVLPLAVSGPFHSVLMRPAGEKLGAVLETVPYAAPAIPLVANINGDYVKTREGVAATLIQQVSSAVRWEECIEQIHADGATVFVEVGPGKVLTGLGKKIISTAEFMHTADDSALEKSLAYLKESR